MKNVKSLTVVGGGTAGLVSALILKNRSNLDVNLIYSSNIGIVGVGEGSTEHFKEFMNFLGIKDSEIILECDATFKIGVMFDNWIKDKKYLHSVYHPYASKSGQYLNVYGKQIPENLNLYPESIVNNLVPPSAINIDSSAPTNQYHFNTFKLNDFLKKKAVATGINVFDDDIVEVQLDETGFIDFIVGEKSKYKSDFYIDATGFNRILMNKLDVKWKSFSKYLKLNSAITFPTGDEDNYNYWTLAKAMDAGWRFKIPTWGRHGNGYIYDKNFITADEAKLEVEKELGHEVEIGKTFEFDPGALENVWSKNCVAMGLSGCFFEPLEATSIMQSIIVLTRFMSDKQNLITKNNFVKKRFNDIYLKETKEIVNFLYLHYITNKENNNFWKNFSKNNKMPEEVKYVLNVCQDKVLFSNFDFDTNKIFFSYSYNYILIGNHIINIDTLKKNAHLLLDDAKKENYKNILKEQNLLIPKLLKHKEFIDIIRMEK